MYKNVVLLSVVSYLQSFADGWKALQETVSYLYVHVQSLLCTVWCMLTYAFCELTLCHTYTIIIVMLCRLTDLLRTMKVG